MKKSIKKALAEVLLLSALAVGVGAVPGVVETQDIPSNVDFEITAELAATSGSCGEKLTWTLDDNGVLTINGTGEMTNFLIAASPWSGVTSIKSIVIEEGITSIGDYAFYNCKNLTNIIIPNSVTSLGYCAFSQCVSLAEIDIPNSVTSIDYGAFNYCTSLTSIEIPNSVTSIGEYAFYDCQSLETITVDKNNTKYSSDERGVLFDKDKTTLIRYPGGNKATAYTIPDGVTNIGEQAFNYCHPKSIEIPDSVTNIGNNAFSFSGISASIEIPNSVTSIGKHAFYHCSNLTNVNIPDSVTIIGEYAFLECWSLETITVDENNTVYSSDERGTLFDKDKTTLIQYPGGNKTTSYTIPNSVKKIGIYAFSECNPVSIEIPDSVTIIGDRAFYSCWDLTNVKIPNSVTSIGYGTFAHCRSLTSIEIPNSVTSIGERAFYYCTSLASIEIPNSVTSIGDHAFSDCNSLASIEIPNSVTSIGDCAFSDCTSLEKVTVLSKDVTFGWSSFFRCPNPTIYGYTGSTAETYANKENIPFVALDITIPLGERDTETNVIYAEINGVQTAIEENTDNTYVVEIGDKNLLIEFVEKDENGEVVKSMYYFVDVTAKTVTKLDMDSYMMSYETTEMRVKNPIGLRFKAQIQLAPKIEKEAFVIDEYGFIVATETALGEEELTLDFSKYVTGVAYNKENGTDIVFDASDDEVDIFTGYLKNIPVANYKTNLVCKTYTKISVGGEQFVVYGEAIVGNVYDTAKMLLAGDKLDTTTRETLVQIILDYENTLGIPGDDLYPVA